MDWLQNLVILALVGWQGYQWRRAQRPAVDPVLARREARRAASVARLQQPGPVDETPGRALLRARLAAKLQRG